MTRDTDGIIGRGAVSYVGDRLPGGQPRNLIPEVPTPEMLATADLGVTAVDVFNAARKVRRGVLNRVGIVYEDKMNERNGNYRRNLTRVLGPLGRRVVLEATTTRDNPATVSYLLGYYHSPVYDIGHEYRWTTDTPLTWGFIGDDGPQGDVAANTAKINELVGNLDGMRNALVKSKIFASKLWATI